MVGGRDGGRRWAREGGRRIGESRPILHRGWDIRGGMVRMGAWVAWVAGALRAGRGGSCASAGLDGVGLRGVVGGGCFAVSSAGLLSSAATGAALPRWGVGFRQGVAGWEGHARACRCRQGFRSLDHDGMVTPGILRESCGPPSTGHGPEAGGGRGPFGREAGLDAARCRARIQPPARSARKGEESPLYGSAPAPAPAPPTFATRSAGSVAWSEDKGEKWSSKDRVAIAAM